MQQPYRVIIADTSCFILLSKIDCLYVLLELFGEVTTTKEVSDEFGKPLPKWVVVENLKDKSQQTALEVEIDKGEASAIALAIQKVNSLLILDDYKARRIAANTIYRNFRRSIKSERSRYNAGAEVNIRKNSANKFPFFRTGIF